MAGGELRTWGMTCIEDVNARFVDKETFKETLGKWSANPMACGNASVYEYRGTHLDDD
jgi:hypothetical protein